MGQYTLTHSERNKGWTSFWSYIPDWMCRLDSNFFSMKNGQLWIHNDINNPIRNNFYGAQFGTSVKTVFNDVMAEDKIFKTLVLESNQKWDALLETNLTESSISAHEFDTKESRQFSFIRKNEDSQSLRGNAANGIGPIGNVNGLNIFFLVIPDLVSVGDILQQLNGSNSELIGTITNINRETRAITVNAITNVPTPGLFAFAQKNSRIEGEEIRGYYMEVLLSNIDPTPGELFAISTNAVKSYV